MDRPNIIYIVPHDLGRELGCYGKTIDTPNLNRFAADAIRFDRAFCSSPACMPSRCCAYTGQYAHTNGVMGLPPSGYELPDEVRTIVDFLNDAGYETAHIGLQHERHESVRNRYQVEMHRGGGEALWVENAVDTAIGYLRERRDAGRPFYLNIGTAEVHAGTWQSQGKSIRKDLYGRTEHDRVYMPPYIPDVPQLREEMGRLQACIRYFDAQIGRLFEAITDLGFRDNTLVLFTTDHGISNSRAKSTLYDAGVEVSLIVRMPGGERGGTARGELIQNIDFAPTLLELAGAPVPAGVQGRSFRPLLTGEDYRPHGQIVTERHYHGSDEYDPMRAVRTPRYHYIRNLKPNATEQWRPQDVPYMNDTYTDWFNGLWPEPTRPRAAEELFDTALDTVELNNVADDPAYKDIRADLAGRLDRWMRETNDPLLCGEVLSPKRRAAQGG